MQAAQNVKAFSCSATTYSETERQQQKPNYEGKSKSK